jgi:hypothetical protein
MNLHHLRIFTEGLINTPETVPDIYKHIQLETGNFEGEYLKFKNKVSKLYVLPELSHHLEDDSIDFVILDCIDTFIKTNGEIFAPEGMNVDIRSRSIIKAFENAGLLYAEKHYSYINVPSKVYLKFFKRYSKETKSKFKRSESLEYYFHRLSSGLKIGDMGENPERSEKSRYNDFKECSEWDTDLYGTRWGYRQDPGKQDRQVVRPGNPPSLDWKMYGYGRGFYFFDRMMLPFKLFAEYYYDYPHKYLANMWKHQVEGKPEVPLGYMVNRYLIEKQFERSDLPNKDREVRLDFDEEEIRRARMKIMFIYEHPEFCNREIKWRDIKRFFRKAEQSERKYHKWFFI